MCNVESTFGRIRRRERGQGTARILRVLLLAYVLGGRIVKESPIKVGTRVACETFERIGAVLYCHPIEIPVECECLCLVVSTCFVGDVFCPLYLLAIKL